MKFWYKIESNFIKRGLRNSLIGLGGMSKGFEFKKFVFGKSFNIFSLLVFDFVF